MKYQYFIVQNIDNVHHNQENFFEIKKNNGRFKREWYIIRRNDNKDEFYNYVLGWWPCSFVTATVGTFEEKDLELFIMMIRKLNYAAIKDYKTTN